MFKGESCSSAILKTLSVAEQLSFVFLWKNKQVGLQMFCPAGELKSPFINTDNLSMEAIAKSLH